MTAATTPDGFKPPPDLHQPRRKRRATIVQVCPSSPEQRARWVVAAEARGESLSAFLAAAADARAGEGEQP